jgi:acyl carrier protein
VTDRTDPALDPVRLRDACGAISVYLRREFGTQADIDLTTPIADLGVDSIELVEMLVTLLGEAGDTEIDLAGSGDVTMDRVGDLAAVLVGQGWQPQA